TINAPVPPPPICHPSLFFLPFLFRPYVPANMDPKTAQEFQAQVEGAFHNYDMRMAEFTSSLREITEKLSAMCISLRTPPPITVQPVNEIKINPPDKYDGNPASCRTFLCQCEINFSLQESAFSSERSKVAYVISLLTGRAAQWATAEWARDSVICSSYRQFSKELKALFDPVKPHREAARQLTKIRQGTETADEYIIRFRTIACNSAWNEEALYDMFYEGLSERVKDELAARELPRRINDLMSLAARIDRRIQERGRERHRNSLNPRVYHEPQCRFSPKPSLISGSNMEEPMQLGRTQLSKEERDRRFQQNLCFYCAAPDHRIENCPVKGLAPHERRRRV
uniref:Retrotransposon gag domain-containing protein n=1 Tax=Oryzias latipes TaxID=8090 RepID=A0A3B3IGM8_ORYLA